MTTEEELTAIDQKLLVGEKLSADEQKLVMRSIHAKNPRHAVLAALIILELPKSALLKLLDEFPTLPLQNQRMLVPIVASSEYVESYKLLFRALKNSTASELTDVLVYALAKTDYRLFPLLMVHLSDPDLEFQKKLKRILKEIGLKKVAPYLSLYPVIPYESIFRAVFGNNAINDIYQRD